MTDIFGPASADNAVTTRPSDGRAFGAVDSWFRDCSTPSSDDGTEVEAAWYNQVTAAMRGLARVNGKKLDGITLVVPEDEGDDMALRGLEHLIQRGLLNSAVDSGSASNVVATLPTTPAELIPGLSLVVQMAAAPTGASTLTLTGYAAAALKRRSGKDVAAGDWAAGDWVQCRWTGTYWQAGGVLPSDIVALIQLYAIIPVSANKTLWVRTDGSDANDGSINTSAKAFATIAAAIAYGTSRFFFAGFGLIIQLGAAGTYAAPPNGIGATLGSVTVQGDASSQAGYIISGTGPAAGNSGLIVASGCTLNLTGLTLVMTGSNNHTVAAVSNATINLQNVTFQNTVTSAFAQIFAGSNSNVNIGAGCISATGNTAGNLFNASYGGTITMAANYTVGPTQTLVFSVICATFSGGRFVLGAGSPTFTGNGATGQRYNAQSNSTIITNGAGANFFPGNSAGSTASGGQYL